MTRVVSVEYTQLYSAHNKMPYTQQLNEAFGQLEGKTPHRCATFAPIQLNLILSWADEIYN